MMKSLLIFLFFVILSTNATVEEIITSSPESRSKASLGPKSGNYVYPDQFINMINEESFTCQGCGMQLNLDQAERVRLLNMQFISHMRYKLDQFGYKLYPPPPLVVNWFDFAKVAQRKNGGEMSSADINGQNLMMVDMVENAAASASELEKKESPETLNADRFGQVFGVSLQSSMKAIQNVGDVAIVRQHEDGKKLEDIPKIVQKKDMIDAREKMKDKESDVYFIFFHNEADTQNEHIQDFLEVVEKFSNVADFYTTDTGFALFWAEQLDIYRMFDTIVAVHPQSSYFIRNDNPTIQERATYLPIQYQYYDEFVQLANGDFMNFARLHLDLPEEDSDEREFGHHFPHIQY